MPVAFPPYQEMEEVVELAPHFFGPKLQQHIERHLR